ncbi:MAG: glycosyltransferase [Sarcina sp.]
MEIFQIIKYLVFIIYLYNTIITLFSWKKKNVDIKYIEDKETFLVFIPAHNEQEVIEETLKALYAVDYKKELYKVCVIADNCSDNTENIVLEFIDKYKDFDCELISVKGGSKPKAINKATKYLKFMKKWDKDNIIIIDSDNKVSKTLLKSYNYYHQEGHKILQCKIVSHNDESFIAKGFTSSFNTMNEGFQFARNQIGLSASLSGTGFSVNREVWDSVDFNKCDTLTEDLEFSILSILSGYKVFFVLREYVLNQNLDKLKPSIIQRVRWCRGHMQVSVKLTGKLFKSFIHKPSLQLIDSILFVNTPSKAFIYSIANIILFMDDKRFFIPMWIMIVMLGYNFIFILYCDKFKFRYIIPHMFFALCMYFIIIWGAITYKKSIWVKTEHKKIETSPT